DSVSLTKPATTGNAVEMQNTIAAVTASERLQSARGWVGRGVGLGFAPWLVGSDAIGCPSIKCELSASCPDLLMIKIQTARRKRKAYSDAAVAVRKKEANKAAKVFAKLKSVYPDDTRFKADFSQKEIGKAKLARYILTAIGNMLQGNKTVSIIEDEKLSTL